MHEVIAAVTSKGQVTIPKRVREQLGVGTRDRVVFRVGSDGSVTVRALRYPTLESLVGAAGKLPEPEGDPVAVARDERARRRRK